MPNRSLPFHRPFHRHPVSRLPLLLPSLNVHGHNLSLLSLLTMSTLSTILHHLPLLLILRLHLPSEGVSQAFPIVNVLLISVMT